jgi:hypothetical protein
MPTRFIPPVAAVALAAVLAAVPTVDAQTIHKYGFAGKQTALVKADANVAFQERDHVITDRYTHTGPTSEYIRIEANPPPGATEAEYVHYAYDTPPAPVTDRLTAQVWVKALRAGVQVKARVVFPKEKDPRNPDAPLTTLVAGDVYKNVRTWQALGFGSFPDLLAKQRQVLLARLGREINEADAYIDRILLNVYTGPGVTDVWVDDVEIGPVRSDQLPPPKPQAPGVPAAQGGGVKARSVEFTDGQILIDDKPFFMLAIRHTNTPLKTLRDAMFNTVWFPNDCPQEVIDEAVRNDFWIVPTLPLPAGEWENRKPKKPDPAGLEKEADAISRYLRKFLAADAVLMWDFGGGRTAEDLDRVAAAAEVVRTFDPRRPRSIDLWDGYSAYSRYVNALGAHRWPLFSSLELTAYRDWLAQRKALTAPGNLTWTWVQTHMPDWFLEHLCGRADVSSVDFPVGPHPEQIRILTYLALAAGHRGLGYWSDRFLDNAFHGRDRLLEIALLNSEIEMLQDVLFAAQDPARWIPTSDPNVQAAVIRGPKDILVLPVWLGPGSQYTPAQGTVPTLSVTVPLVPDQATPWLVTPAGVSEIKGYRRVAGGTEVQIPEFDTAAAIVFTQDLGINGKVVRWQDHTRYEKGRLAAQWAQQQAIEQFNKTLTTHKRILEAGGPELPEAAELFHKSEGYIKAAAVYSETRQWDMAYREARRALRPLRVLMHADWAEAARTLDVPTASPYAVSFYSLPQHWLFAREVASSRPAGNGFPHGGFELSRPAPKTGASVTSLPGWTVRKLILDRADGLAAIVNTDQEGLLDRPPEPPDPGKGRYAPQRVAPRPPDFRQPDAGHHCLMLRLDVRGENDESGRARPAPQALERTVLAVDSPPADFAPGSLVRVSFWAKVPYPIGTSADNFVVFDTAGGEPLGVRIGVTTTWKEFHLYRRVPAHGKVAMTFALTGFGTAFVDDVRIEPMVPFSQPGGVEYRPPAWLPEPLAPGPALRPGPPPAKGPPLVPGAPEKR